MSKRKLIALSKSFLWSICILLFPILSGTLSAVLSLETTGALLLQGTFMLLSPVILLHFMFDFETKVVVVNGAALLTAECIRGVIMVIVALWFAAVIGKMEKVENA